MDLSHILREFIYIFSAHRPIGHNRQNDKLLIWKRFDHAMNPTGYAAHHIWITPFCYYTNPHLVPSFAAIGKYNDIFLTISDLSLHSFRSPQSDKHAPQAAYSFRPPHALWPHSAFLRQTIPEVPLH